MGMGARSKRAARLAKVFDVASLRGGESEMNRSWMTQRDGDYEWYWVPIGIGCHGASDLVDESNFEVAEKLIEAASDFADFRYRYDNWVGPQVKTLMVRVDDAGALREALRIMATLADYPVLSDEDYSEREHDAMWHEWDNDIRADMEHRMERDHELPGELFYQGWSGGGEYAKRVQVTSDDMDAWVQECDAWANWSYGESLDMEALAKELAARIRVKLAGKGADQSFYRECRCCGDQVIGPVWSLCHGCDADGECNADESWHCDGRAGHLCDGTVCEEQVEEIAERDRKTLAYGGMLPEDMTPLW
jgi:hypothetical protein